MKTQLNIYGQELNGIQEIYLQEKLKQLRSLSPGLSTCKKRSKNTKKGGEKTTWAEQEEEYHDEKSE